MNPFITTGSRTKCKKCDGAKFERILDDEDGITIPICLNCKIGRPKKYRVAFSLPEVGSDKFKKYLKGKNEIGEALDSLTKAKNFKSYIENKLKVEGVNFDPRELGSEKDRKLFYVENLIPMYLKTLKKRVDEDRLTPGGYRKLESILRLYILPTFGKFHVKQMTTPVIKREISKQDLKVSIPENIIRTLGPFMSYAADLGLIPARPQMPNFNRRVKNYHSKDFYTGIEQNEIIKNIKNPKYRIAITILAKYSGRKSEVECLTWGDIDFKKETISFNKHVSEGIIINGLKSSPHAKLTYPFFPGLRELLFLLTPSFGRDELIFPGSQGGIIGKDVLRKAWVNSVDKLIEKGFLNKKVDLHRGTRSTTLSELFSRGYTPDEISELYGGDVKTMLKYYAKKEVQNVAHLWE